MASIGLDRAAEVAHENNIEVKVLTNNRRAKNNAMRVSLANFIFFFVLGCGVVLSIDSCPSKAPAMVTPEDSWYTRIPFVDGGASTFVGGKVKQWNGERIDVTSPIVDSATAKRTVIGAMAQMTDKDALEAVASAKSAWAGGQGKWPQMSAADRIEALEKVIDSLLERRDEIVNILILDL